MWQPPLQELVVAVKPARVVSNHHAHRFGHLDPSLRELLRDVDLSLLKHKTRRGSTGLTETPSHRELEVFPNDPSPDVDYLTAEELDGEVESNEKEHRKSPAALFGSLRIGAVILPLELQGAITKLIAESDRPMLHSDAKRLFLEDTGEKPQWGTAYDTHYKSRHQASRHAERDGTAFASVALPSHYSAICAVFDHLKRRMGPEWNVEKIIDWGSAAGSGLWASLHSFQKSRDVSDRSEDLCVANSTITSYLGIDKREGLVNIGKRLMKGIDLGAMNATWQKSFQEINKIRRTEGKNVIALSAFMLSSLPTPLSRKALVKEIWESGAEMMILIDHNTTAGYENIAEAREVLLRMGRKELENPEAAELEVRGSHVIAPCPHDGACPLYHPGASKLICSFSQRLQTPQFLRKTKHSGIGHEDIGYSYVAIRRGPRPVRAQTTVGRVGGVGKRELVKLSSKQASVTELLVDGESHSTGTSGESVEDVQIKSDVGQHGENAIVESSLLGDELDIALRAEAYNWPRLVFPPLKRSGHIIIDGCTQEGKIMRMTIPKSQGKQPFYDARKSSWGDIFPHEPKNTPQERHQPQQAKRSGGVIPIKGDDIGKRRMDPDRKANKSGYGQLSDKVKERNKRVRRERVLARGGWAE
ncbi:hypothetical protein NLI96_g3758 [Meripilus lineatus]|uniref:Rsm22-domain-containing protein n=1 Tax=Meripilus lineatus TaxID=2056292 RepID=A0AAD5VB25_9APHY|nr:hypothetical protein NLI96_g3758 [Physisporinus lineatus]